MSMHCGALAAASAAVVLLSVPVPAHAAALARPHRCETGEVDSRGRSSVDGNELTWDDSTTFDDARKQAARVWSAGTFRQVKIKPDGATTYADLEWKDTHQTGPGWKRVYGKWDPNTGTDSLWMNKAYLGPGKALGADVHRRRVAAHELGHALGFCHKAYGTGSYPSLMWANYDHIRGKRIDRPTAHDIKAYHALWG
ncbi:matrixin family metalloprotease [Streptomyces sp. NPDC004111]|uniref:matrixin family metalloprotease n=1 Tax=Streptomyces sp. NPDC004111 TaxID=3364690 RepID=UPI0036A6AE39